ncbi:MAG: hypothetical protein ABI679_05475, partial [Gemmatimonadota bacterium]
QENIRDRNIKWPVATLTAPRVAGNDARISSGCLRKPRIDPLEQLAITHDDRGGGDQRFSRIMKA